MSSRVAVGLAGLVVAALVSSSVPGAEADPAAGRSGRAATPGSSGIGDPYFPLDGNGGINVVHYDVHDRYEMGSRRLSGWTRLSVVATQDLARFNLDFLLPVSSVRIGGVKARHSRPSSHELQITPASPIAAGTAFKVKVQYAGHPGAAGYLGERNWLASPTEVVAMNEPHMAPWWFPANDHPRDKASFDLHINVPATETVVANGRRVGTKVHGKRATTHWRAKEPMAPYLAFFAAGRFAVRSGVDHGVRWVNAVSRGIPGEVSTQLKNLAQTPRIVRWLAGQVGPYPFATTGGLVTSLEPGFALENQTRPTYQKGVNTSLLVHELAHQWFGDSVSVHGWKDIWLNEGFATFMELRYAETHGGQSAAEWLDSTYDGSAGDASFWDLKLGAPTAPRIFDSAVYVRGAMALQALRNRIGSPDFFTLLQTWARDRRGRNGSIEQFTALAEQVSGEDLDGFFQAWLYSGDIPAKTADNGLA